MKKEKNVTAEIELAEPPKRRDLFGIKPENIIIAEGFNKRKNFGDIEELALNIKENGQKQPLRVYRSDEDSNKFVVIDGERRTRAIRRAIELGADIQFIDALLEPKKYNHELRLLDILICNDGLPLSQLEQADVYLELLNVCHWPVEKIIKKSGKSSALVYNMLGLATVPEEVKTLIAEDKISAGTVMAIQKNHKKPEQILELTKEAIQDAKEVAVKTGKAPKKATVKNIKSTTAVKTPFKILEEVVEEITNAGVNNDMSQLFLDVIKAAKSKKSVKSIVKMINE